MTRLPSSSKIRFWRGYLRWLKDNRIFSGILIAIAGLRLSLEHPDVLAFLLNISEIFSLIPSIIQWIAAAGFILSCLFYRLVDWRKEMNVSEFHCWYDGKNRYRSIMIDESVETDLSFKFSIGPAVKKWGIRITTTKRCRIQEIKNIRSEYAPEINTEGTKAWVHGQELEDEILVVFELRATKADSSPNAIITLEKIANDKLDLLLASKSSWEVEKFDFLWRRNAVVL